MPQHDFRSPRLFVDAALASGETVALERNQSNYLGNVLRLGADDTILAFNGRDGEWRAVIAGRKRPDSLVIAAERVLEERRCTLTDGHIFGGLVDLDELESPRQRMVVLEVLAVLFVGRRADATQLP